jgi:sugar/nucleoside kinase (ribokinase family)/phosphoglycolate phosphatase-like HAD superfamily hydrolase
VVAFGVIGNDPFGWEMLHIMRELRINVANMVTQKEAWQTHVYIKPYTCDKEHQRMDCGNFNKLEDNTASRLLQKLERIIPQVEVVIINQQVLCGIHTLFLREGLVKIIKEYPAKIFLVDSRTYSDSFAGASRKINGHEAARLCGIKRLPDDLVLHSEAKNAAVTLYKRWKKPVFISRGSRGCLVCESNEIREVPGLQMLSRVDVVGAGDSMLAGIAAALAAGKDALNAAIFGNFVAGVTVQKLFQTGTASPREILEIGKDPDYIYRPELAEDIRQAKYYQDTEIEIIAAPSAGIRITHIIFDHDGTISALRQGWEAIMEPMMTRSILGDLFDNADESLYQKVVRRVRGFIDKTTGMQTLVQMRGLIDLIHEFGCVPEDKILDEHGYKRIYNQELLNMVNKRMGKLKKGELSVGDFTMKNAVPLLEALYKTGIRLYLASGTDQEDVIREAEALGYAHLFEGRIYGSVGDITKEAKKIVLERILKDIGESTGEHLLAFGDGPVEIRETHKRGGYTVGIASDEVRRYGLNAAKRSRLIKAGADMIVPDFSQLTPLLHLLKLDKGE